MSAIEAPGVTTAMVAWLEAALPDHPPPYQFELIAAGGSNLTYIVTSRVRG